MGHSADIVNGALEEKLSARIDLDKRKQAWRDRLAREFFPNRDFVLVKTVVAEQSAGGILMPDTKREITGHGIVIAVGPKVTAYQKGDHVYFSHFVGDWLRYPNGAESTEYRLIEEQAIFGGWREDVANEPEPREVAETPSTERGGLRIVAKE